MIYMSFLLKGVKGVDEYNRNHYPKDSNIEKYGNSDYFYGDITKISQDEKTKTIHIDNAYKVTVVADKIRDECTEVWNKLKIQTTITFVATLIGSLVGIASALALGVLLPHLFPVALAIGVISLGIFGFSFFALHRSNQTTNQIKMWTDPTDYYIQVCRNDKQKELQESLTSQQLKFKNEAMIKFDCFIRDQLLIIEKNKHLETKSKIMINEAIIHGIEQGIKLQLILRTLEANEINSILDEYHAVYTEPEYSFLTDLKII